MDQHTSSSKVTGVQPVPSWKAQANIVRRIVEYFDPSGVFHLVSPGLLARLPLRNLHWKSPSRPLRSITSLHVDLVPNAQTQQQRASATSELSRVKSTDSSQSVDDGFQSQPLSRTTEEQKTIPDAGAGTFKGLVKERRHQIPGLRETP